MYHGRISMSAKKQIASLLSEQSPSVTINIPHLHYQPNYVDWGVFAIAFLVSLLFNQDPATLAYNEGTMRSHLLKCLKQDKFTPFPLAKIQEKNAKKDHQAMKLSLMCNCRMPWNKQDLDNPDLWCTQCENAWSGFTRSVLQQCLIQFSALKMSSGRVQNANHNFISQSTGTVLQLTFIYLW